MAGRVLVLVTVEHDRSIVYQSSQLKEYLLSQLSTTTDRVLLVTVEHNRSIVYQSPQLIEYLSLSQLRTLDPVYLSSQLIEYLSSQLRTTGP